MSELIKPSTVSYEDSVVVRYPAPMVYTDGTVRSFTIDELEDVLTHARLHDADGDVLVKILERWSEQSGRYHDLSITLHKNWSDVSSVPQGRYRPVNNRFWYGLWCGAIFMGVISLVVILLIVTA